MSNPLTKHPHIYKKGRILNIKKLNEGETINRQYCFSSTTANLTNLLNSTNNLNQVLGRVWLGISKLTSYFGLSKDPSDFLSKTKPLVFNRFERHFQTGGVNINFFEEIKNLLKEQNTKFTNLEEKINELRNSEKLINREEVIDFTEKLKEIQTSLKAVLGE